MYIYCRAIEVYPEQQSPYINAALANQRLGNFAKYVHTYLALLIWNKCTTVVAFLGVFIFSNKL
jgi:hypothetical protein